MQEAVGLGSSDHGKQSLVAGALLLLILGGVPGPAMAQEDAKSETGAAAVNSDQKQEGDKKTPEGKKEETTSELAVNVTDRGASVFAVNADVHDVFSKIATATGLPMIVDDTVQGKATVNIVDTAPREIIAILVDAYGLAFSEVDGVLVITEGMPKKPSSYLMGEIEAVTTKYVQPARARSLLPIFLQSEVKMNTDQNAVVLSGPRAVLDKFRQDVEQFDKPAAQIMLDVLVVEYTNLDAEAFSAQVGGQNDNFGLTTDTLTGQTVLTAVTTLPQSFYAHLRDQVTQHKARVRANPRVATVSGLDASVFIGQEQYLSKPVTMPDGYSQTNSISAGVRLNMVPLTGGQGDIILWLDQEISTLSAPDATTGLPTKTKRTATTTVRVRDGQTVVIGGLRQAETREKHARIPIISEIPLIGNIFTSRRIEKANVELAVFITARILDPTGHLPAEEEQRIRDRFLEERPKHKP